MKNQRKVILYIAQSLDGFIADKNDDISWLSVVEKPGEDYGYQNFLNCIDTVIMGRRTYEKILSFGIEFPHKDKTCFVISRSKTGHDNNVKFINENLSGFVNELKSNPGKNIYLDGGAVLVHEMLDLNLIDEMIISIIPVLLGNGIHLFGAYNSLSNPDAKLHLQTCKYFETGLVQLHYIL